MRLYQALPRLEHSLAVPPRLRLLVLAQALSLLAGCGAADVRSQLRGILLDAPYARPSFTLTDTRDRPYDFRGETAGRLTLLYFGYTHCADVCPMTMANIAGAMRSLPAADARRVRVVFVTVDPERDTPAALGAWLAHFDPSFVGLGGPDTTVARVEASLHLAGTMRDMAAHAMASDIGHAPQVVAITPDDSAHVIYRAGVPLDDWRHDLPLLLEAWPARGAR